MLGLGYLFLFGLYLLIIFAVVRVIKKWAIRHNKSASFWGALAALCMLSTIFWDLIPIYGLHYKQCSDNGGVNIYKSIDQWKKENPNIAETLMPENRKSFTDGNITRYQLNQRFVWEISKTHLWHILYKKTEIILDIKTGKILAEYIDFYTSLVNPIVAQNTTFSDFKIWMRIESCEQAGRKINKGIFYDFESSIGSLGRNK
jgi:hypothetical protein